MASQRDVDYFLKREVEERARIAVSANVAVRAVHRELAERYADAAWSAEEALDDERRANRLSPRHDGATEPTSLRA